MSNIYQPKRKELAKVRINDKVDYLHHFGKVKKVLVKKNFLILDLVNKVKRKLESIIKNLNKKKNSVPRCVTTIYCLV